MEWVVNIMPLPLHPRNSNVTHCTRGWVAPKSGLKRCGKSHLYRDSIPGQPCDSESISRKIKYIEKLRGNSLHFWFFGPLQLEKVFLKLWSISDIWKRSLLTNASQSRINMGRFDSVNDGHHIVLPASLF